MTFIRTSVLTAAAFAASLGMAHAMDEYSISGSDQDVSGGSVTASSIMTAQDGWLVVHRTDANMKPGPVVGHAWIKKGENTDVAAELDEDVASGDMLMLMVHGEEGGMKEGEFEYTLGAKEDGPVKVDGKLVMTTITAQ
ncbi:MAG: hypothetical protein CML29_14540 [Rhizobiales bacterium]|nr:hypothetical protein [Hyphomicrobiales bacterium]MBA70046.1 hypothetical protein [Hyphomicrobiales bacterium]|tara:strand:+ start:767 stop:1183 length:417 start_codon:yes stop_codon:yes gene_type:complete